METMAHFIKTTQAWLGHVVMISDDFASLQSTPPLASLAAAKRKFHEKRKADYWNYTILAIEVDCCSKNFLIFAQLRTGKRMKEKVSLQDIATDKEFSANDLQFTPRHITFIFSSAAASFSLRPSTTRSASYFSLLRSSNSALSSTVSAWTSCHTTAAGRLPLPAPPSYSVNGAFAYSQH